jgi:hypothetical protein
MNNCKKIEIITKEDLQAAADAAAEKERLAVAAAQKAEEEKARAKAKAEAAAAAEAKKADSNKLTETDKQSIQKIAEKGGNIAKIAADLKQNRGLDRRSILPEKLLIEANKLYHKLSE